ncbi:uncharacterized protein F4822DRAFT_390713 [Hypoxylon trugodes]|uniref:uncharacterized protein n=1 Tax=Hypoxylon trugodes TaxID=326681 RepID=UPI00218DCB1F|nr:uncharacterized protein F4822DRAFT_390713 [Hypoxylon trugodes]KAI1392350.1 hypothetical protein F4822DRAFT_390713 [Hypoxylon trugodes]
MDQPSETQARSQPKPTKMNYACEACRISKVKCQSGPQPGICKRCSEFKRECIFRTGPRIRRPKVTRPDAEALPPPPGPSQTFSIDFAMPTDDALRDNFDDLREKHERFIEELVPSCEEELDEDSAIASQPAGQTFSFNDLSMRTPSLTAASTVSSSSRPMSSLGIQPRFNLDSAAKLLDTFRSMLPYCPCIMLPANADVPSLARDMPFVLLAILAVASCSTSLQGHSLYDEEFRKILGLKFVTGGERSLELLQGLIVYCSWYPFHLRPKNRQSRQYMRMAVDIVHDLELDEETNLDLAALSPERREIRFQTIRAYISCFYNVSTHSWAWSKPSSLRYTMWMAKCCDTLEQYSDLEQDHILVWLVRLQYILNEFFELDRNYKKMNFSGQSEHHHSLVRMGLETQLREFQTKIPGHLSITPNILIASLIVDAYLLAAPLMQNLRPRPEDIENPLFDPVKLQAATYTIRAFFDYVLSLPPENMGHFCGADIGRFIVVVILGYRLSFPVPACPTYDYAQGRRVLDFGTVLTKLSTVEDEGGDNAGSDEPNSANKGSSAKRVDVAAAMKVVLRSLKAKYDKKSADLEAAAAEEADKRARQCPMFDGSLDQYLPLWEGQQGNFTNASYATPTLAGDSTLPPGAGAGVTDEGSKPMLFHDLWATMTMSWIEDANAGVQQEVDMADMENTEGLANPT